MGGRDKSRPYGFFLLPAKGADKSRPYGFGVDGGYAGD